MDDDPIITVAVVEADRAWAVAKPLCRGRSIYLGVDKTYEVVGLPDHVWRIPTSVQIEKRVLQRFLEDSAQSHTNRVKDGREGLLITIRKCSTCLFVG